MNSHHLLDTIGNTPLIQLQNINPHPHISIYVKLEYMNPSGSIKDRIVKHIIEQAEIDGHLKPNGTIVENTSGNTGAAVAMLASSKGYEAILTMPDKVSQEKQDTLKALGAKVVICSTSAAPDSPEHYVNTAKRIAKETPNSFQLNQYDNPASMTRASVAKDEREKHGLSNGLVRFSVGLEAIDDLIGNLEALVEAAKMT